jgi:predicted ribosome quality control (RQC) complex YloA/Tae2 family protein
MVKLRLSTLDAKAAIDEVRTAAVGLRLINVYDLSPRVYLMKFGQGERKVYVLFESGVRLHVTTFSREKPKVPSQFTLKLRKHVRSWRLEEVQQIGTDRVVDLRFGNGEQAHHFVLELYGHGNFFLTDAKYTILMLLRSSKSEDVRLAVRETYPVDHAKQFVPRTREEFVAALTEAKESDTLRACLPLHFYGSLLADHMLASCGLNPAERKSVWVDEIPKIADSVFGVCQCIDSLMAQNIDGGGILVKLGNAAEVKAAREKLASSFTCEPTPSTLTSSTAIRSPSSQSPNAVNRALPSTTVDSPDEFWPIGVEQFLDRSRIVAVERVVTFSEAVDRCFRSSEQEKITSHNTKKEQVLLSKKEKFLRDHQRRIDNLTAEEDRHRQLAELIQLNVGEVDAAINLINDVLATGMTWDNLGSLVRLRQAEGHPIANIIHDLNLYKNSISLLLTQDCADDEDVEDADIEPVVVDVDLGLSGYGNAAKYHSQKKTVKGKLVKTLEATEKASEAAEKTGERQAKKVIERRDITSLRQPLWFEKFNWFLTSFGHIVVSGHDPMQSDLLFRKYLASGDVFVHGDAVGCQPAIVKNPTGGRVPMPSIEEAGIMCIARSEAWRKAPVSAWWCRATQVSKRTPQGDHLSLGQFFVTGVKNYMPAMQLQLAVAVLFRTTTPRPPREAAGVTQVIVGEAWNTEQPIQSPVTQEMPQVGAQQPQRTNSGSHSDGESAPSTQHLQQPSSARSTDRGSKAKLLRRGLGSTHASHNQSAKNVDESTCASRVRFDIENDDTTGGSGNEADTSGTASQRRESQGPTSRDDTSRDATSREDTSSNVSGRVRFTDTEPDDDTNTQGGDNDDGSTAMELVQEVMNNRTNSMEDDIASLVERMNDELASVVPLLDGNPATDATIKDVLIVCAPYPAVRHYAYKARIAPGVEKKGQAANAILHAFSKYVPEAIPAAAEAMKLITSESIISQLAGPLKVHLGDIAASTTASASGAVAGSASGMGGEAHNSSNLSVRARLKLKKEEQEKLTMEKLRNERKTRLEAKAQRKSEDTAGTPITAAV